jgi:hypothetical protein
MTFSSLDRKCLLALLVASLGMLLKTSMMVVIRDCFFVRGSVITCVCVCHRPKLLKWVYISLCYILQFSYPLLFKFFILRLPSSGADYFDNDCSLILLLRAL